MKNKVFSISIITYVFLFTVASIMLIWGGIDFLIDKRINIPFIISSIFIFDFFIFSNRKLFRLSYNALEKNKRQSIGLIGSLIYLIIFSIFKIRFYLNKNVFKKKLYKEVKVWINNNETIVK